MAFGFDDFNNIVKMHEMPVDGIDIVEAYNKGHQMAAEREKLKLDLATADRKAIEDATMFRIKAPFLPAMTMADAMTKIQGVNVLAEEPSMEDMQIAFREIMGDAKNIKPEQAQQVMQRAQEIARQRTAFDISDPLTWLKNVDENIVSNAELDRIKSKEQMELALQKEDAKDQRQMKQLMAMFERQGIMLDAAAERTEKIIRNKTEMQDKALTTQERLHDKRLWEAKVKEINNDIQKRQAEIAKKWSMSIFRNRPNSPAWLRGQYEEIKSLGNQIGDLSAAFGIWQAHKDMLIKAGAEPPGRVFESVGPKTNAIANSYGKAAAKAQGVPAKKPGKAPVATGGLSSDEKKALDWAKANPNHPGAKALINKLRNQGKIK